jgi:hypothetical protein
MLTSCGITSVDTCLIGIEEPKKILSLENGLLSCFIEKHKKTFSKISRLLG